VAGPRRDDFPNNYVGDLVQTERGWTVVPPTCCPAGHDYGEGGWSVSSVWCTCNDRHLSTQLTELNDEHPPPLSLGVDKA